MTLNQFEHYNIIDDIDSGKLFMESPFDVELNYINFDLTDKFEYFKFYHNRNNKLEKVPIKRILCIIFLSWFIVRVINII